MNNENVYQQIMKRYEQMGQIFDLVNKVLILNYEL